MEPQIALATVSGRAYFQLVTELKKRSIGFDSLTPWNTIPLNIQVVITTTKERHQIAHPNILTFNSKTNPTAIINEAMRTVQGKKIYDKIVIGVDPGKNWGLAVLGDQNIIKTDVCTSLEEAVNTIQESLDMIPGLNRVVKVGNGAPNYSKRLITLLDRRLPNKVLIEIVSENRSSNFVNKVANRRDLEDAMSAIELSRRNGQIFHRKKNNEEYHCKR